MVVEYHSHRPGLAPFVVGLIEGIGTLFGESVKVEQLASRSPLDIEVGDAVEEEIGEAPPDKFTSTRGMDGGPNAEAGRNARKSLLQTQFS